MMNYTDQYSPLNIPQKLEGSDSAIDGRLKAVFTDKFDFQCLDLSILRSFLCFFGKSLLVKASNRKKFLTKIFLIATNCRLRR